MIRLRSEAGVEDDGRDVEVDDGVDVDRHGEAGVQSDLDQIVGLEAASCLDHLGSVVRQHTDPVADGQAEPAQTIAETIAAVDELTEAHRAGLRGDRGLLRKRGRPLPEATVVVEAHHCAHWPDIRPTRSDHHDRTITALRGAALMRALRFHGAQDLRLEDIPEPAARRIP